MILWTRLRLRRLGDALSEPEQRGALVWSVVAVLSAFVLASILRGVTHG